MMFEKQENRSENDIMIESKETTAKTEKASEVPPAVETCEVRPVEEVKQQPITSEDIMSKIMKAKQKASTALNEYAKSKKK